MHTLRSLVVSCVKGRRSWEADLQRIVLSHSRARTLDALNRAVVDDGKAWVALSPTQTAEVLCEGPESVSHFIRVAKRVEVELGALARNTNEDVLQGKSPWQWIKEMSGAGDVNAGYTRRKRKISPLELKGQRLWLGYDALSANSPLKRLGVEVPSLVELFQATRLGCGQKRRRREQGDVGCMLAANVLLQQIRDDEGCPTIQRPRDESRPRTQMAVVEVW